MSWLGFLRRYFGASEENPSAPAPAPTNSQSGPTPKPRPFKVRRYFFNMKASQCYGTFFPYWGGWITAGHVMTSTGHKWPPFVENGKTHLWPAGLDAALQGCQLPDQAPPKPYIGQKVKILGFPAGSRTMEERHGEVYLERDARSGIWIAQIHRPDEPVVSGMSGGPVICKKTDLPIGILITRNSPADLDRDQIVDQSCDFISLSAVWYVLAPNYNMA